MKQLAYHIFTITILGISLFACKQVKLADADKKFGEGEYFAAADMYRQIYRKTPAKKRELRGEVAFKMAESYRLINNPIRANAAYANAVRYNTIDSTIRLQYARSLQKVGDYKNAAKYYDEFLKLFPGNQFALNGLEGCKSAPEWKANPTLYKVKAMTLFNGNKGGEFRPSLLPPEYEQLYFSSNRKGALGDTISEITGAKTNDIFMARKDENGEWMLPEKIESPINTVYDEGAATFSANGSVMYYTFCPQDSLNSKPVSIYISQRTDGSWNAGTELIISKKDSASIFAHPAINESGEYLYFVSDMQGGFGGKDIWRAKLFGDNTIEYIENLGSEINTAGDEMFPYMRNDSTLYFSSDGHIGMGGLDIYKAVYNSPSKRWKIENMKAPINSFADDFGITFEGELESGFFSSNRNDARGFDHIYSFVLPSIATTVEGYIVDKDDEFVPKATIRVVGKDGTNTKIQGKDNGTYSLEINRGTDYVFLASAEGYLNRKMTLRSINAEKDSTYFVDFVMMSINKPVVLENIFYDFNKATLREDSKEGLDELVDLLKVNPNVTIELSAHTDRKGTDEYNDDLSQRRAETVVDYLIRNGIEKERLTAKGYGKRRPKAVTRAILKKYDFFKEGDILSDEFIKTLPAEQQEIADQINRRTEFKVLSITYNLE